MVVAPRHGAKWHQHLSLSPTLIVLLQDSRTIETLQELESILRLEYERSQATPAMRLLDDVLELLGDEPEAFDYQFRKQDAGRRLRDAFLGGEMVMGLCRA